MNQKSNMIRQILTAFFVVAAVVGFSSCERYSWEPVVVNPTDSVHFQAQIQPIFNANCLSCHGAIKAPDLRDGKSYKALTTGGYVTPTDATCKLYSKMTGSDHAPRSSYMDKQKILIWITQGALNN